MSGYDNAWKKIDYGYSGEIQGFERSGSQRPIETVDKLVNSQQLTPEQRYEIYKHFWEWESKKIQPGGKLP